MANLQKLLIPTLAVLLVLAAFCEVSEGAVSSQKAGFGTNVSGKPDCNSTKPGGDHSRVKRRGGGGGKASSGIGSGIASGVAGAAAGGLLGNLLNGGSI